MQGDEDKTWKVLRSVYTSRDPWFTVREEDVLLPNGSQIPSYHVLEYPDWVNVIAITRDGLFIMERQYRHALARVDYELCAGVMDPTDSTPLAAARRELMEETGYGGGQWEYFMTVSPNPGTHTNLTHCCIARGVELLGPAMQEETEDISVHLLTRGELMEVMLGGGVIQALHAAPLWKYMALFSGKN